MKINQSGDRNHKKNKEKLHQNSKTIEQPKAECGLFKQLLCNFQTDNLCDPKQLKTEVKNGAAYKIKRVTGKFSETDVGTKKGKFGLGYGHKIQPRNPIKYFIMTK